MELLRLYFPGVHHALREALASLHNFASNLLGDTAPSTEELEGKLSRENTERREEVREMTKDGSQKAEQFEEALGEDVVIGRDLEDTVSSRGLESKENWKEEENMKDREIQESEIEGIWKIGKEVGVDLNVEMARGCRTWDSSSNNSKEVKEAKGEIRGNYKTEVQGVWCVMGTESKQGQKIGVLEARGGQKEGILAEGYLEPKDLAEVEKVVREPKVQDKENQEPNKKEVNVRKAEYNWKREETMFVGEQKKQVKEIKPGDLEGRALKSSGLESEIGIIWEMEMEGREAQEREGNVRDLDEAKVENTQSLKKGEPGNSQKLEMETRESHETKKAPNRNVWGKFEKDGKVETPEKKDLEEHEAKETWEVERIGVRYAKKEIENEMVWEDQGTVTMDMDKEKLQGVQEPGEKAEREDSIKSEVRLTSIMKKAEAWEAIKSKTAETSLQKEGEKAGKVEDKEINRGEVEVIHEDWGTEEAAEEDLERKKDEERDSEGNFFPQQVWTHRTEEEEMTDFGVLGKMEIVKVPESGMEVEESWGKEGEAGESYESQLEQNGGQDIQGANIWEGTPDYVERSKELESVQAKEVMGSWKIEHGRIQEVVETDRIDDTLETSVTKPENEIKGAKLMKELEVGKSQELETKDKVSYETEEVREDQSPKETRGDWNIEADIGGAQETEKDPWGVQDPMEEEAKEKEEEAFRILGRDSLEDYEREAQNIKNIANRSVQEVKKQDLVVVEGWKIVEEKVEVGQVTEKEDRGGCEGKEEAFTLQTREDMGDWEAKGSQEFKQQEISKAEAKTGSGTKESGTTEPKIEEKEVRRVWEEFKGGQEAQVDRNHKMEESEARKLQKREEMEAKEHWEIEGEVLRSQGMKKVEGGQEREDKSQKALDGDAEEDWEGSSGKPWTSEIVNEKEVKTGRSLSTEQRDWKEIKREWDSEEATAIRQERTETKKSPSSNLSEVRLGKALEEENKGFWEMEGTEECQVTEGLTETDQIVEESEARRTWEREEKEFKEDQETGSADAEESWIVEKVEVGSNCEKKKSAFCQARDIQMEMTNKDVELTGEEEMKEREIKSEKKPGEDKVKRETEEGGDGYQGMNSKSTWSMEEERLCEKDDETDGKISIENQVEANGGRKLEAEKMEGSDNIEESGGQGDEKRKELEPDGCSDTEKAASWEGGVKDSEVVGIWKSNEKTEKVWDLKKAGQDSPETEEAADTCSGTQEASENKESEAPAPISSIALRLSPVPSTIDEATNIWNEAPAPSPCLDLSIPRSRVLLSRNASHRRSRPSFRRAPAPGKDDSNDDESLSFLPNEESPASKLRLIQAEETSVPSVSEAEGTPVIAKKRPPGQGFGLAHPSMMKELQARLGRPKPQ